MKINIVAKFNIIYTPKSSGRLLWNGAGFDKLNTSGKESLLYSGKSIDEAHIQSAMTDVKNKLKHLFPDDPAPKLKAVVVKVS